MGLNRVALISLGLACVIAAGVGGYLGTRHDVGEVRAAAAPASTGSQTAQAAPDTTTPPQTALKQDPAPTAGRQAAGTRAAVTRPSQAAPAASIATASPSAPRPADTTAGHNDPQATSSEQAPVAPAPMVDPAPVTRADERADAPHANEAAAPSYDELVVAADSVIGLQTETSLSSEHARVEDRVEARVVRDVRVGGRVAIPAGTRALGNVVVVERGGHLRERARLGVRFNTLALPDGTRLPITTETIYRYGDAPGNGSAAKIGGGTVAGAILGAILGGGKGAAIGATTGAAGGSAAVMAGDRSEATLPAGMEVTARMLSPVTVSLER